MNFDILQIVFIVIGLLNLFVSIQIARRDDLEVFQKIAQIMIVWVIPLFGAVGIWLFHNNNDNPKQPKIGSFGGGPRDSAGVSQSGAPD